MPKARTKAEVGAGCGQRWISAVDKNTTAHCHGRRVGITGHAMTRCHGRNYPSANKSKGKITTKSTTKIQDSNGCIGSKADCIIKFDTAEGVIP